MKRRVAALLRALADRLDPQPRPQGTPGVDFVTIPPVTLEQAREAAHLAAVRERLAQQRRKRSWITRREITDD